MKVTQKPIDSIKPYDSNPRDNDGAVDAVATSLQFFGWRQPIVVDKKNVIIVGHTRWKAAKKLGMTKVPVHVADLTEEQAKAYRIADNQTGAIADWDTGLLAAEVEALQDMDFDLGLLGFPEDELAGILGLDEEEIVEDEVPEPPVEPITKPGELWVCGEHRVLCGDSTKAEDVARVMGGEKADLCFTSPPYGQQRDYDAGQGKGDWDALMQGVFGNLPMADAGQVLVNLGLIHRDGEWIPYWDGWIEWMRSQGWRRFGWYVWDQGSGLPGDWGGRLAPSHEFLFHLNRSGVKPEKTIPKNPNSGPMGSNLRGKGGECGERSSICDDPNKIPDSVVRVNRNSAHKTGHPATFPVPLPASIIAAWPGNTFDPFLGSGTTLIAAEQLGRRCFGLEISPAYCDVIVARWENLTGKKAKLSK